MRDARINKIKFWYAVYTGDTDSVDTDGHYTGEKTVTYGTPTAMYANISPPISLSSVEPFGVYTPYSRTIYTCNMDCPINEKTILWIGKNPATDKHNFIVTKVSPSLNSIVYGIKEVEVSG